MARTPNQYPTKTTTISIPTELYEKLQKEGDSKYFSENIVKKLLKADQLQKKQEDTQKPTTTQQMWQKLDEAEIASVNAITNIIDHFEEERIQQATILARKHARERAKDFREKFDTFVIRIKKGEINPEKALATFKEIFKIIREEAHTIGIDKDEFLLMTKRSHALGTLYTKLLIDPNTQPEITFEDIEKQMPREKDPDEQDNYGTNE